MNDNQEIEEINSVDSDETISSEAENVIPYQVSAELQWVSDKMEELYEECSKVLVGQEDLIELLLVSILSGGHVLLEGVPGIAKTLATKVMAKVIDTDFSRIQFTPDLMPSDILGTSIYDMNQAKFNFRPGPIFSNLILIDEINRAPAKTQSALFEVMEENQITFDGTTYNMEFPFIVIATQNPIEQEGTYRLPEGQLDRFLMKIKLGYPSAEEELEILKKFKSTTYKDDMKQMSAIISPTELSTMQLQLSKVYIEEQILKYITDIIQLTRDHGQIYLGASPRAGLGLMRASKATAMLRQRDFVIPDDVQYVAEHILNHRMILSPSAEIEGYTTSAVIKEILKSVEVPR